jgi:hypothetical protein
MLKKTVILGGYKGLNKQSRHLGDGDNLPPFDGKLAYLNAFIGIDLGNYIWPVVRNAVYRGKITGHVVVKTRP